MNFSFNSNSHEFWSIYETIKRFYPIGLKPDSTPWVSFDGTQQMKNIIQEKIRNIDQLGAWNRAISSSNSFSHPIEHESMGAFPCYSLSFEIERSDSEIGDISERFYIKISLLGNYFTVFGTYEASF